MIYAHQNLCFSLPVGLAWCVFSTTSMSSALAWRQLGSNMNTWRRGRNSWRYRAWNHVLLGSIEPHNKVLGPLQSGGNNVRRTSASYSFSKLWKAAIQNNSEWINSRRLQISSELFIPCQKDQELWEENNSRQASVQWLGCLLLICWSVGMKSCTLEQKTHDTRPLEQKILLRFKKHFTRLKHLT